jgi:hypothetical protein
MMAGAKVRQNAADALKAAIPLQARRWLVRRRLAARRATAGWRELPDFLILGGQRCGTSSLYKYLSRHPEIAPSLRKETEYFTINYGLGEAWYRAHFPLSLRRRLSRGLGRTIRSFEATPDYLFDPRAPERAAALLPTAPLIVVLRDPVERAYSHYHHNVRLGLEDLSFAEAIAAEEDRLASDLDEMQQDPLHRALNYRRYSYFSRGLYAEQLTRWFERYPRDQFLVLMAEDLFAAPEDTLHQILRYVGASKWSPPEFHNYSYTRQSSAGNPEIPDEVRRELYARFESPNHELGELLGTTLSWGAR